MIDFYLITIAFGKAEEMEKFFDSLNKYVEVSFKKIVFINTQKPFVDGKQNIEIFSKYRQPGDRGFLCNGNFYTTPYRYAIEKIVPLNACPILMTECDIWLTKKSKYFESSFDLLNNKKCAFTAMMTEYYTAILKNNLPHFDGFTEIHTSIIGKGNLPWHFMCINPYYLYKFFHRRSKKNQQEISDGRFTRYCREKHKQKVLAYDGRNECMHFDDFATINKYPYYKDFYKMSQFRSTYRRLDKEDITEI